MVKLAPQVYRQRLLIEAIYTIAADRETVRAYLLGLAEALALRVYGEPVIHSPGGQGSAANQGFDAFVPLVDSGIACYVWTQARLVSVVVYSCKPFDRRRAVTLTRAFWRAEPGLTSRQF
ncbi:MAG: S-adenosylmethionine decarboxylase [Thermodesulfobacteriota bacterium]